MQSAADQPWYQSVLNWVDNANQAAKYAPNPWLWPAQLGDAAARFLGFDSDPFGIRAAVNPIPGAISADKEKGITLVDRAAGLIDTPANDSPLLTDSNIFLESGGSKAGLPTWAKMSIAGVAIIATAIAMTKAMRHG